MAIVTLGIDLAKDVFALRGEDSRSIPASLISACVLRVPWRGGLDA